MRGSFIVTYSGEYSTVGVPAACKGIVDVQMSQCRAEWDCKCQDVANNTYYCVRKLDSRDNSILCQFDDDEKFIEAYDLNEDPFQLNNIYVQDSEDNRQRRKHIRASLREAKEFIDTSESRNTGSEVKVIDGLATQYFQSFWRKLVKLFSL